MPQKCDGCGAKMTVEHGLSCKTGGLVVARHNDVRNEWAHLCSLALGGSAFGTEPLIFYGTAAVPEGVATADDAAQAPEGEGGTSRAAGDEARGDVGARGFWKRRMDCIFDVRLADLDAKSYKNQSPLKLLERFAREKKRAQTSLGGQGGTSRAAGDEARGDIRARGFWQRRKDCIFDVRLADLDAKSYKNQSPLKLLERFAGEKKKKYGKACHERRRDFTPLVYSVDGVPCEEAKSAERRLAGLLAQKWERNYSEMCGYVRTWMSLSIIRSQTLLLRGERANTWRRRGALDGVAAGSTPMARHG
eukprot:scaffold34083_cov46-Cyclotella_meneghiniana.AAC.3